MFIWRLIETIHNAAIVMVYIFVSLWIIALLTNIVRRIKARKYKHKNLRSSKYRKKYKKGENVDTL